MKTLSLFLFFYLLFFSLSAQNTASVSPDLALDSATAWEANSVSPILARDHLLMATNQLRTFLSKNLMYSETMQDNLLEGTLLLEISISKSGIVEHFEIIQADNKTFEREVVKIMQGLDKIIMEDDKYHGPAKVRIPISFSF